MKGEFLSLSQSTSALPNLLPVGPTKIHILGASLSDATVSAYR